MLESASEMVLRACAAGCIDVLVWVPLSGATLIFDHFERNGICLTATREEEALAIAAGLTLCGRRPLVLMQQSGVGNALNVYFSLSQSYDIRLRILVVDRGIKDENPVQRVSSAQTCAVLQAIGCKELNLKDDACEGELREFMCSSCGWALLKEGDPK